MYMYTINTNLSYCHIEMAKQLEVSVCSYIEGEKEMYAYTYEYLYMHTIDTDS
jgi:hypothetical protein